jgi:hypothetical protein
MRNKGQLFGAYYVAELQPENTSFWFSVEGRVAFGYKVNYQSNGTGNAKDQKHRAFEGRLLGSYCIYIENQLDIEGYTGLGIRYLTTLPDKRPSTTGHYNYFRRSEYDYIPVGVRVVKVLSNDVRFIGHLEYDLFLRGQQKSNIRNVTVKDKQPHGYGARIGMDFQIPSSEYDVSYTLGIFSRYWNIKDSIITNGGYEPKNSTQEYGVRLGLLF